MVRRDPHHVHPQQEQHQPHPHPKPPQHTQHANGSMSFTSISKNMLSFNGGGGSSSSRGSSIKYAVIGLLVGLVVGMQLILLHGNPSSTDTETPTTTSGASLVVEEIASAPPPPPPPQRELQHTHEQAAAAAASASGWIPVNVAQEKAQQQKQQAQQQKPPLHIQPEEEEQETSTATGGRRKESSSSIVDFDILPPGAEQQLRSFDEPWPKPLNDDQLQQWLDILGNYTQGAPAPKAIDRATEQPRPSENHLFHLPSPPTGPVNIKTWVQQGKCHHADKYLALILDRLLPWSNKGISSWMVEEAARTAKAKSDNWASLLYQIIDGRVYAKHDGADMYIDRYAGLFINTLKYIKMPNIEFALHNGKDLPVIMRHEVHPVFAYASADAFAEMLLPCPWYVMALANAVGNEQQRGEGWAPMGLEEFKQREGKLFWRGGPNDFVPYAQDNYHFAPRMKLAEEGQKHRDLLDVHVTSSLVLLGGLGWEKECELYTRWGAGLKDEVPEGVDKATGCTQETVMTYRDVHEKRGIGVNVDDGSRYALNLDGTGFSERYAKQLASSQLVFKVDTPFYNYYSRFFLPYQHYIPVKYDLSDLAEKVQWANDHLEEAHRIMTQASTLAHQIFSPDELTCYVGMALAAYGRLLGYDVTEPREDVALYA